MVLSKEAKERLIEQERKNTTEGADFLSTGLKVFGGIFFIGSISVLTDNSYSLFMKIGMVIVSCALGYGLIRLGIKAADKDNYVVKAIQNDEYVVFRDRLVDKYWSRGKHNTYYFKLAENGAFSIHRSLYDEFEVGDYLYVIIMPKYSYRTVLSCDDWQQSI